MDKSSLDAQLAQLRLELQNGSLDTVRQLLLSEKFQGISSQFDQRCHFFLAEGSFLFYLNFKLNNSNFI
jgi:hypothetical protein